MATVDMSLRRQMRGIGVKNAKMEMRRCEEEIKRDP
jgi:hypothetical protein